MFKRRSLFAATPFSGRVYTTCLSTAIKRRLTQLSKLLKKRHVSDGNSDDLAIFSFQILVVTNT